MVIFVLLQGAMMLIFLRFSMHYAPFHVFGAFQGYQQTLITIPQILFANSMSSGMGFLFSKEAGYDRGQQYSYLYMTIGTMAFLSALAVEVFWRYHPPPPVSKAPTMGNGD